MGESGQAIVVPGAGAVRDIFEERGMKFNREEEVLTPSYYSVDMEAQEGGRIFAEQSASTPSMPSSFLLLINKSFLTTSVASRVGHLRFTFTNTTTPYVLLEATRASIIGSADVTNTTLPVGTISINPSVREITGSNPERQDHIIQPISTPATNWKGYFCARFDADFETWGVSNNGTVKKGEKEGQGTMLSGYATFKAKTVNVRVGVSFISVEQARRNLDAEIPDGTPLEETARKTRAAWAEKLDRVHLEGATTDQLQTFYTGFFHTLQVCIFSGRGPLSYLYSSSSIPTSKTRKANITPATTMLSTRESHIPAIPTG